MKIRQKEKRDKNLDLARELKKKLWNMKVTVIPVIIGMLGTSGTIYRIAAGIRGGVMPFPNDISSQGNIKAWRFSTWNEF